MTETLYQQARLNRDPHFDGKIFIADRCTDIFCRTICPIKLPPEKNVRYFHSCEAAMQAGFRPCLRCKPEFAPSYLPVSQPDANDKQGNYYHVNSQAASRLADKIKQGELLLTPLADMASAVNMTARDLNILFRQQFTMSVKEYQTLYKALFAKKLLFHSNLSIKEIATACGYRTVSGLYALSKKYLHLTAEELLTTSNNNQATLKLILPLNGDYNWQYFLAFQKKRLITDIETIAGQRYTRNISLNGDDGFFTVFPGNQQLHIEFSRCFINSLPLLLNKINTMFDLRSNITLIENVLQKNYPQLTISKGIHIPGVFSPFEAGMRAICGQQISVTAACRLLNSIVQMFARTDHHGKKHFPVPEECDGQQLEQLKMISSKRETLKRFFLYCQQNTLTDIDNLLTLKGIGKWSVDYIKLRATCDPDIWMAGDLGIKQALARTGNSDPVNAIPWRSYLSLHLWNQP